MKITKVFSEETVRLDLKAATKMELLEELLDVLVAAGHVQDRKAALKALVDRENKMSTGMQHGLALPHAKCDAVDRLVAAIGIKKDGMDFQSIDHEPSKLFILTLSPLSRTGPHIQFLAEIGRQVSRPEVWNKIMAAATPAEIMAAFEE